MIGPAFDQQDRKQKQTHGVLTRRPFGSSETPVSPYQNTNKRAVRRPDLKPAEAGQPFLRPFVGIGLLYTAKTLGNHLLSDFIYLLSPIGALRVLRITGVSGGGE